MHWEKLEIIEWLVENASNKEIEGLYKFMGKQDFKSFREDMWYIDNKYLEEDE